MYNSKMELAYLKSFQIGLLLKLFFRISLFDFTFALNSQLKLI